MRYNHNTQEIKAKDSDSLRKERQQLTVQQRCCYGVETRMCFQRLLVIIEKVSHRQPIGYAGPCVH